VTDKGAGADVGFIEAADADSERLEVLLAILLFTMSANFTPVFDFFSGGA
jgi:hypothetical protein